MENLRNKTQGTIDKKKDYLKRFSKLNVYSYIKDDRINLGCKPTEVYSLFNGNTSNIKKKIKTDEIIDPSSIVIDQSAMQYYIILALQDLYYNYAEDNKKTISDLQEENKTLRDELSMLQTLFKNHKKM